MKQKPPARKKHLQTKRNAMSTELRLLTMSRFPLICVVIVLALIPVNTFGRGMPAELYPPDDDRDCWGCHRLPNIATTAGIEASQAMCFECHRHEACERTLNDQDVSVQVKPQEYAEIPGTPTPRVYPATWT